MSPRIAVVITHAAWDARRRQFLMQLQRALGKPPEGVSIAVVADPAQVPMKERRLHLWAMKRHTFIRGLVQHPSHVLALEDDVLPGPGFLDAVVKIASAPAGEHLVALWGWRETHARAWAEGASWWLCPDAVSGPGMLYPAPLLEEFLAWDKRYLKPDYPYSDGRVALFACSRRDPVWCTCPSLLQHVAAKASLLGTNFEVGRVSQTFQPDLDASQIDWADGKVVGHGPSSSIYRGVRNWVLDPKGAGLEHML
jgi:hypothetical protein